MCADIAAPLPSSVASLPYMAPEVYTASTAAKEAAAAHVAAAAAAAPPGAAPLAAATRGTPPVAVATAEADMWALGVVAFELLSNERAFPPFAAPEAIRAALRGSTLLPWEQGAPGAEARRQKLRGLRGAVLGCLNRDPTLRPTAKTVLTAWNDVFDQLKSSGVLGPTSDPPTVPSPPGTPTASPAAAAATAAAAAAAARAARSSIGHSGSIGFGPGAVEGGSPSNVQGGSSAAIPRSSTADGDYLENPLYQAMGGTPRTGNAAPPNGRSSTTLDKSPTHPSRALHSIDDDAQCMHTAGGSLQINTDSCSTDHASSAGKATTGGGKSGAMGAPVLPPLPAAVDHRPRKQGGSSIRNRVVRMVDWSTGRFQQGTSEASRTIHVSSSPRGPVSGRAISATAESFRSAHETFEALGDGSSPMHDEETFESARAATTPVAGGNSSSSGLDLAVGSSKVFDAPLEPRTIL